MIKMMEIMHTSDMVKVKRSRSLVREEPGATRMYKFTWKRK